MRRGFLLCALVMGLAAALAPVSRLSPVRLGKTQLLADNNNSPNAESESALTKNFVPLFVGVWAVGYTAIAAQQVLGWQLGSGDASRELGERGGLLGVGLTVFLFLALVVAAGVEVFKDP